MPSLAHIIVEPEKRDGQNSLWNNIGNMAAPVVQEATPPPPDGATTGAASRVMPPRPPSQSPPRMGTVGPQQHFSRSRPAVWQDERGSWCRVAGLQCNGGLLHECIHFFIRGLVYQSKEKLKQNQELQLCLNMLLEHRRRNAWYLDSQHYLPRTSCASHGSATFYMGLILVRARRQHAVGGNESLSSPTYLC